MRVTSVKIYSFMHRHKNSNEASPRHTSLSYRHGAITIKAEQALMIFITFDFRDDDDAIIIIKLRGRQYESKKRHKLASASTDFVYFLLS